MIDNGTGAGYEGRVRMPHRRVAPYPEQMLSRLDRQLLEHERSCLCDEKGHCTARLASAALSDCYALAPFDAGDALTLQSPTIHQVSQQVDR